MFTNFRVAWKRAMAGDFHDLTPLTDPAFRIKARINPINHTIEVHYDGQWISLRHWTRMSSPRTPSILQDMAKAVRRIHRHGRSFAAPFDGKTIVFEWVDIE